MATRVLLLRHAQSTWNVEGRWQGWADPPLSDAGREAARAAAGDPELAGIEIVVASDLSRALQTADELAAAVGPDRPEVNTLRGLRERGAGLWTGLTRAEIDDGWPGALETVPLPIPDGEPIAALAARAIASLHRLAGEWPDCEILAVTHGGLIRQVEATCGAVPDRVPNLAGRWVEVSGGRVVLGPAVGPLTAAPAERAG